MNLAVDLKGHHIAETGDNVFSLPNQDAVSFSPDVDFPPFYFTLFYLFIYLFFWLCWVFVAAHEFSLVAASGGYSSLWCAGFSLWWLLLLWSTGSRHVGFSSCGTRAQ